MSLINQLKGIPITALGVASSIRGSLDFVNGHPQRGGATIAAGLMAIDLSIQGSIDLEGYSKYSHCILGAGIGAVGIQGALRLANGVQQKSVSAILEGGIKTAVGIAGTALIYSIDAKILQIAHRVSVLSLSSALIVKRGVDDLVEGKYRSGVCKLLAGIGGIATSGYCVYSAWTHPQDMEEELSLKPHQLEFLKTHEQEINRIYRKEEMVGEGWRRLGLGMSKETWEHPSLPGMVIKIPYSSHGFRGSTGEDDLRIDYENFLNIRRISGKFPLISIPQTNLYEMSKNKLILVQEKFSLEEVTVIESSEFQLAQQQLKALRAATGLCDLKEYTSHNAAVVSLSTPLKIGIIDFDCQGVPPALALRTATATLGGVAALAKKIAGIRPSTVLGLGFGMAAATCILLTSSSKGSQFVEDLIIHGSAGVILGAAAGAVQAACTVVTKVVSWIKGRLYPATI